MNHRAEQTNQPFTPSGNWSFDSIFEIYFAAGINIIWVMGQYQIIQYPKKILIKRMFKQFDYNLCPEPINANLLYFLFDFIFKKCIKINTHFIFVVLWMFVKHRFHWKMKKVLIIKFKSQKRVHASQVWSICKSW